MAKTLTSGSLTLDAGALIAAQKRSRLFLAALERVVSGGPNVKLRVPAVSSVRSGVATTPSWPGC